jgi:hypothetical protein
MTTTVGPSSVITAPLLAGIWLHSTADPAGTENPYPYQSATRTEALQVEAYPLQFVGRTFPVIEYGEQEQQTMKLGLMVPWSDTHDEDVAQVRGYARGRATLCYRDNRSRLIFGAIPGEVDVSDEANGSIITFDLMRVDYVEGS